MKRDRGKPDQPITTTVVRSVEPIDFEAWLDRYARFIVEAEGLGPTAQPRTPRLVP